MSFPTTDRLKRWYQKDEVHFAVAHPGGEVQIGIAPRVLFLADDKLAMEIPAGVWKTVQGYVNDNSWIALHPGGLGAVKAPYQLKGKASVITDQQVIWQWFPGSTAAVALVVDLLELYTTKPGPEAGRRVDQWSKQELTALELRLGWLEAENL